MMKLYYSPGACSLTPHIVLRETKLPFTLERVDLAAHKTEHGADYYTVSSKGMVPLLELEDGQRLSEGPIIVQYVCDKAGRQDLMPGAGTLARYRVMEWQNYISAEIHKSFSPFFIPELDAAARGTFLTRLQKRLAWISQQLRDQAYLAGNTFSAADAYLFTCCQWGKYINLDLSGLADLQSWTQRIVARPAVQAALSAEGLLQ